MVLEQISEVNEGSKTGATLKLANTTLQLALTLLVRRRRLVPEKKK